MAGAPRYFISADRTDGSWIGYETANNLADAERVFGEGIAFAEERDLGRLAVFACQPDNEWEAAGDSDPLLYWVAPS